MNLAEQTRPIARRTLHDELVERLRALVTQGALKPGEKIPERELCERFGVSRTPMREALKVLAADGLVTLTPNRGATVTQLTIEDLEDVFPVMGALEALAGEIACRNITSREIDRVRDLHERMVRHWQAGELQPYFRCNQQIHEAILNATRNATLQATYRSLSTRIMSARYIANMTPERWKKAVAEHVDILAALEARDEGRLAAILRDHLANKLETVREWLTRERAGK
ncbi:MAG: GntR family transcriptional regulator [Rhodobiaceae bacterium]|nr:GntR family transcriptional regulator [Rhodobiaceae bacterium]